MKNLLLFIVLFPHWVIGQSTVIKDVNILDVRNRKLVKGMSISIRDGQINQIDHFKKLKTTAKDSIIDGNNKFLLPGLIDSHIHFFQSGGLYTRPDAIDFRKQFPYSKEIQFGKENASDYLKRYLSLGITTVMDVGGPFWNFTIRDSIAQSMFSPNVLVTGPLFSIVSRPQLDEGDPPIIKVENTKQIDSLFKKMQTYKPDFIKVWYIASNRYPAEESFPLVKHIGDLCKNNDLLLAVHATQLKTAELAVDAGANILVHSIDDQVIPKFFIKKLKQQNVTYIPTLIVSEGYTKTFTGNIAHHPQDLKWANPFAYSSLLDLRKIDTTEWPSYLKRIYKQEPSPYYKIQDSIMKVNLKILMDSGINVATGTDAGNIGTLHASSYLQELEAMADANLTNWDIIVGSTINPAKGFGISENIGSIEIGKQADLLLLSKNPIDDIRNLNSIELLVKAGKVLTSGSILEESAEQLVQRQVNAYNARNMEAFLATYSADIEIYDEKGKLIMKGHEQMRERYKGLFNNVTNLYCEIENRIIINNKVIDKEKVRLNNRFIEAVAVYEVANGRIVKVQFIE